MSNWRYKLARLIRRFEYDFVALNRIEVSKSALLHNCDILQKNNHGMALIPVLKSNAYGHGLELVAQVLAQRKFPYLAVDGYFEALRINMATAQPVLVMGYIHPDNYPLIETRGFAFVVHDEAAIKGLGASGRPIKVHLEVNTGMYRHGTALKDLEIILELIKHYPSLQLEGVMSHLADADSIDNSFTESQVALFEDAVATVRRHGFEPAYIHLAQTAGSTKIKPGLCNAIRPGIGVFGVNPLDEQDPEYKQLEALRPAARLISTITKVNDVPKGERVSYNGTWTAPQAARIGVIPIGYYEGIPRALSNVGVVQHKGEYLSIAGRVCMNHTLLDLGSSGAQELDEIVVISNNPKDRNSINGWRREHGLFTYGDLVALSPDTRRVLVD